MSILLNEIMTLLVASLYVPSRKKKKKKLSYMSLKFMEQPDVYLGMMWCIMPYTLEYNAIDFCNGDPQLVCARENNGEES